jgi:hypothetical protein
MRVLLVLSLLFNVILAATFWPSDKNPLYRATHPKIDPVHAAAAQSGGLSVPETRAGIALASGLKKDDPAAVRDQLRALGLPEDVVRGMLHVIVYKRTHALQQAVSRSQVKPNVFWKIQPGMFSIDQMTKDQRKALRESMHASADEMEKLMGPDPEDQNTYRTSFLPSDKAAKVRDLERDYSDLLADVVAEARDFRMPADEQQIAYLEKEKRADLAAMLTPEELADYDLRNSPTANRLRFQLQNQGFDATESEYKAIYAAQKAIDDRFANSGAVSGNRLQAYQQAEAQANEQLRAELGDARYADYMHSQDPDYRALESAAKRFNLPDTAVAQTYQARDQALASSQIILNNANLTDDQRRQQLQELADQTRAQIQSSLGQSASDAYLARNMGWLQILASGTPIAVGPNGQIHPVAVPQRPSSSMFPSLTGTR